MTERTRKPRRKQTTDLGKSIMQRERQRLAREQAALEEKLAEDARRSRRLAAKQAKASPVRDADRAVQRSIVRRCAGVLSSEGVNVAIHVEPILPEQSIDAWTNFEKIHIGYHIHQDVKLTAAVLRGLFYHEGGHCRWTLPFPDLQRLVLVEQNTTQDVLDEDTKNRGLTTKKLHRAWNALEDQRMETAVTSDSPRKAGYFAPMILSELAYTVDAAASNWPLLVWRRYLPENIVKGARRLFVTRHGDQGETFATQIEEIVTRYVMGKDGTTLYSAVLDMAAMFELIQPVAFNLDNAGHERQHHRSQPLDPDALQIPIDPGQIPTGGAGGEDEDEGEPDIDWYHIFEILSHTMLSPEKLVKIQYVLPSPQPEQAPQGGSSQEPGSPSDQEDESDDEGQEGDAGNQSGSKDNESAESNHKEGGSSGSHQSDDAGIQEPSKAPSKDELSEEDLSDALAEAEEERLNDPTLDQDVKSFQDASADGSSKLDPYIGGVSTNGELIAAAHNLSEDMQRSFDAATVDLSPAWHEGQRRGVLNPLRYVTRQPGDVEFFRSYVDNGSPGHDLAVSVLLDYSGSMGGVTEQLAQVAYASKVACQNLGIPCTVVLWDTNARTLWDASEEAEALPVIQSAGGTNPEIALADLDNHVYGKSQHIVLIMTDDAWSGSAPTLASIKQEGRTTILLRYGGSYMSDNQRDADFAYTIKDLNEIASNLEQALIMAVA